MTVHDSPVRADQVQAQIRRILDSLPATALGEEKTVRVTAALESALRVLRRDDDGREAAKHLQTALRLFESKPRAPSPFLDD
jgi:hypothetical protein